MRVKAKNISRAETNVELNVNETSLIAKTLSSSRKHISFIRLVFKVIVLAIYLLNDDNFDIIFWYKFIFLIIISRNKPHYDSILGYALMETIYIFLRIFEIDIWFCNGKLQQCFKFVWKKKKMGVKIIQRLENMFFLSNVMWYLRSCI